MSYVNVSLIGPDKERYTVDIDPDLGVESVKSQLVRELELAPEKKYSLHLVDSFKVSTGDEILLIETPVQAVKGLKRQADGA